MYNHVTNFCLVINFTTELGVEKLPKITWELWLARVKWYSIGVALGVDIADLDAMKVSSREDAGECLSRMLNQWLRQVNPPPTYSALIEALKSPLVGYVNLAHKLSSGLASSDAALSGPGKRHHAYIVLRRGRTG